jgi:hypothetical protein
VISTINKNNQIIELPTELLPTIFPYFSLEDLLTCRQICSVWRELAITPLIERGVPKELVKTIQFVTDTEKLKKIFSQFITNLGPREKRHFTIYFPLQMEHFRLQISRTGFNNQRFSISTEHSGTNRHLHISDAEQAVTAVETLYSELDNAPTHEGHVIVIKTSDQLITTTDPHKTNHLIAHLGSEVWTRSHYRNRHDTLIQIGSYVRSTGIFDHGATEFRRQSTIEEVSNPLWEIVNELDTIQANQLEKIRQGIIQNKYLLISFIAISAIAAIVFYSTLPLNATCGSNEL